MFEDIIQAALAEDLEHSGDITTHCVMADETICFSVNARESMVISGMVVVRDFYAMYGEDMVVDLLKADGSIASPGDSILVGKGKASLILSIERTLLNFLQRASGISSLTREFVDLVRGTKAVIRSTRKTSPCLRKFDLYAVSVGGGSSYRMGLYDGIMVKDNHISSCGSITECVSRIRSKMGNNAVITVECDSILQVDESIKNRVHTILLDNMSISEIHDAVSLIKGRTKVEASGGITKENVRKVAEAGVDYISIGSITNAFKCKDIGLDIAS